MSSRRRNNQRQSQSNLVSNPNNQLALVTNTNTSSNTDPNNQLAVVSTNYNSNSYNITEPVKKDKLTIEVKENPSVEELKELLKDEKFYFKFNNINKSAYIDCHKDEDYYIDYYKTFGKPQLYGLYEKNCKTKVKELIGTVSLIHRYDNKVCQIMDLKIKKSNRGNGGVSKLISSTSFSRMFKYEGYYGICMNTNTIVEHLTSKIKTPKLKNRGKMLIYLISFEDLNKILPILSTFYSSDIAFIDNTKSRLINDSGTKKPYKILHLHHNAEYREDIDYNEPQRGYQYCFSLHESSEFIIKELKEKYQIESSSSAIIYSSDFKTDWNKFVKTYEI
jgi:hypothetical protein